MLLAPLHLPCPINHNSPSTDIQLTLNGDVTNLEIKQAIFSFKPYKARLRWLPPYLFSKILEHCWSLCHLSHQNHLPIKECPENPKLNAHMPNSENRKTRNSSPILSDWPLQHIIQNSNENPGSKTQSFPFGPHPSVSSQFHPRKES